MAETGAGGEGKFGTDGPLEAGTLSVAGAPVPFGESLKGMRFGDSGAWPLLDGGGEILTIVSPKPSGSAAAKASAVAGSTWTGGRSVVSRGSTSIPNAWLSSLHGMAQ